MDKIIMECQQCKKKFATTISSNKIYCSKYCQRKWSREVAKKHGVGVDGRSKRS